MSKQLLFTLECSFGAISLKSVEWMSRMTNFKIHHFPFIVHLGFIFDARLLFFLPQNIFKNLILFRNFNLEALPFSPTLRLVAWVSCRTAWLHYCHARFIIDCFACYSPYFFEAFGKMPYFLIPNPTWQSKRFVDVLATNPSNWLHGRAAGKLERLQDIDCFAC